MSGFDAAEAVESLDYDFRPHVDAHGTVPEPSREELDHFWNGRRRILEDAGVSFTELESFDPLDPQSRRAIIEAFASIPEDKRKAMTPAALDNVARLTKGQPTRDELEALPGRLQDAFIGWLMGMLSNPTSRNGSSD
jgi:hypothetical protein